MMRRLWPAAMLACAALAARAQDGDPAKPSDADAKAKTAAWAEAAKAGNADAKAAAIDDMASCPHASVISLLAKIVVGEEDSLREKAAAALGQMNGSADAAKALHAALNPNEKKTSVLDACFKAIENLNNPASVSVCAKFASDRVSARDGEELPGVMSAIDALGGLKWKTAVDALIDLWHKSKVAGRDRGSPFKEKVRKRCDQALRRLTGENMTNQKGWDDWWSENSKRFNPDMTTK